MTDTKVSGLADDQTKLVQIHTEQIVSEVIQLALTHMLLEAEAGKNTQENIRALERIQRLDSNIDHEHDVTLWKPNLPRSTAVKNTPRHGGGVSFATPSTSTQRYNHHYRYELEDHFPEELEDLHHHPTDPNYGYHHRNPSIIPEADEQDEMTRL